MSIFDRLSILATEQTIPLEVGIELTHRCNFHCGHCYLPARRKTDGLSTERIFELLEELVTMGTLHLVISGGEPTLHPDWLEIVRRARSLGFMVVILTNGSLIDESVVSALEPLDPFVEISFYSMDPAVFDNVTGVPTSLPPVRRAVELLTQAGIALRLKVPLLKSNWRELGGVVRFAEDLGIQWDSFERIVACKDSGSGPLDERISPEALVQHLRSPLSGRRSPLVCQSSNGDGPLCAAATRYCCISPSGDVSACNLLPGSGGNLNEKSFRDIWEQSPWFHRVRGIRLQDLHTCRNCSKVASCGRCPAQALLEDGDLFGPSQWACGYADAKDLSTAK
jgi:radical SAM protein with 4Fe4S-binding SPASM domain